MTANNHGLSNTEDRLQHLQIKKKTLLNHKAFNTLNTQVLQWKLTQNYSGSIPRIRPTCTFVNKVAG